MPQTLETSIVIALRDAQWITRSECQKYPQVYIATNTELEKHAGDAILGMAGGYLIFEVKSTEAQISDEWKKDSPKRAFVSLRELARAWATSLSDELADKIDLSLRGHHLVYWNPASGLTDPPSQLLVEPYVLGTLSRYPNLDVSTNAAISMIRSRFGLCLTQTPANEDLIRYISVDVGTIRTAATNELRFLDRSISEQPLWHFLGLSIPELLRYTTFLCSKGKPSAQDVNLVLLSLNGDFIYACKTLAELLSVVEGLNDHPPSSTPQAPAPRSRRPNVEQEVMTASRRRPAGTPDNTTTHEPDRTEIASQVNRPRVAVARKSPSPSRRTR